jgi:hypothetical protein
MVVLGYSTKAAQLQSSPAIAFKSCKYQTWTYLSNKQAMSSGSKSKSHHPSQATAKELSFIGFQIQTLPLNFKITEVKTGKGWWLPPWNL